MDGAGLCQRYGRDQALDHVSIEWKVGVHGLVGPNGAGKSTLLRLLALIERAKSGELTVLGCDVSNRAALRGRIGYLPQEPGVPHAITARELVLYAAHLRSVRSGRRQAVARAIELADVGEFADKKVSSLSGGQKRRAFIAATIVGAPEVVLLDEPTAGLDPAQRVAFRTMLKELGATSTVILSTHLVEDVELGCETVTVLSGGRKVFGGSVEELRRKGVVEKQSDISALESAYLQVIAAE